MARLLQGLVAGIGFIGGGAILKEKGHVRGLVTAASLWNTGAIGVSVAFGRLEIAVVLSVVNFTTLLVMTPIARRWMEAAPEDSGRSIQEIDRLTDAASPCVSGVHGLERRTGQGRKEAVEAHPAVEDARAVMEALARARPGLIVEPKGLSVALHYRQVPGAAEAVLEAADRIAHATGLAIQHGRMVVELKTPGPDKGAAVQAFMNEPPFKGSTPIFIGDDLTDEPGFMQASEMGGFGILVGAERSTAARYRVPAPSDLPTWLETALRRGAICPDGLAHCRH